jgi:serine/threonine protein kinase
MDSENWQQIEKIYHVALPFSATERDAYLAQVCAGRADLFTEVESLLAAHDSLGTFLQQPIFQVGLEMLADERFEETEVVPAPTPAAPLELIGMTLGGRYYIERQLDSGGIGEVYLARDKPELMSRRVVVKVLQEKALKNEWIVIKFRQEIEAMTRIDDPGVVGILDAGALPNGNPYLVMQFVEGQNLRPLIRPDRGMELDDAAHIIQKVARALTAAHDNDVIHRDLKPENIMVRRHADGTWQVKVIDFGIAKVRHSLIAPSTVTDKVAGTANYMSPEQLQGKKITATSDVYALGVIAYEMLTGRRPFNPETVFQLSEMQKAGVPIDPKALRPALPVAARNAILKSLSYRAADRYPIARDFGDALAQSVLEHEDEVSTWEQPIAGFKPLPHDAKNRPEESAAVSDIANEKTRPAVRVSPATRGVGFGVLAASLMLALIGLGVWRYAFRAAPANSIPGNPIPVNQAPPRPLDYWLTVQMKDKKNGSFSTPFQSIGSEVFNNGSKLSFHFEAPQTGFLYIINEGPGANDATAWYVLFPNPSDNHGSAQVSAHQKIDTYSFPLDEHEGTETQWIVWAATAVPELEAIYRAAFPDKGRVLNAGRQQFLKEFLEQQRVQPQEVTREQAGRPHATISNPREAWSFPLEISHRDYR